jgi:hypothetical protein
MRLALTLFTGFRSVDCEIPTTEVFLVQGGDRLVPTARHFHEPEAALPPSFPVGDQLDRFDRPIDLLYAALLPPIA